MKRAPGGARRNFSRTRRARVGQVGMRSVQISDRWCGCHRLLRSTHVTPSICAIFPPFIIGNWRWDNVVLALASTLMNLPVIDVTKTAIALHQGREKSRSPRRAPGERAANHGLAVRFMGKAYRRGSINCAEYESRYGTSRERNRALVRAKRTISAWVCKHRETKAVSIMQQKFVT